MRTLPLFLTPLLLPLALAAQQAPPAHGTASISDADVKARIGFLASDSLRGRNTPSPGLETAATYIAAEFKRWGLKPAGDNGDYIQRYPYLEAKLDPSAVTLMAGAQTLKYAAEYFIVPGGADSTNLGAVYVGEAKQGMSAPPEARGKIMVVALADTLPGPGMQQWQNNLVGALMAGMSGGAKGVVVVLDPAFNPASLRMLATMTATQNAPLPVVGVLHSALAPAFTAAGLDLTQLRATQPASPVALPLTFLMRTAVGRTPHQVPNVVGILPGSDPVLKNEYVVFSAHMDHVGVGAAINGDSIYNGADDDASGTTAILEAAQAFAALKKAPRRSLIFLAVSGEEKGLLGSQHFAAHPTVPMNQIVADINIDMIGRNNPDTVVAIGQEYTSLGGTVQQVATAHPELKLKVAPDLWPQENLFTRSDHYSFAALGVPAIFFTTGLHPDYHKPSDEPATIDNDKLARITRLVYLLGETVANAPAKPTWTDAGKAKLNLK